MYPLTTRLSSSSNTMTCAIEQSCIMKNMGGNMYIKSTMQPFSVLPVFLLPDLIYIFSVLCSPTGD